VLMFSRNNKKIRSVLSWLWLLVPIAVLGHSPSHSSTLMIEGKNGQWTLQVRAALTAFEHVVHEEYTAERYSTPKEFEKLVIALLSRNLSLHIGGKELSLNNPKIKLGHETVVVYQVNPPDDFQTVEVKNIMFQHIYKSKSGLMVLKNGVKSNLFSLDNDNNYIARVKIENDAFVLQKDPKSFAVISEHVLFLIAFLLILLALAFVQGLKPIQSVSAPNQSQVIPK